MKILLTGGTGFIGQAIVRAMHRRGWQVDALVRDPRGAPAQWLAGKGVVLVPGDVTRPDGLREAMAGVDVVMHGAGVYELGATPAMQTRMRQVNVQGTDNVLRAAQVAGVARTVYVSTVWALGPSGYPPAPAEARDETQQHPGTSLTPYEASKLEAHRAALAWRAKGLPLVIGMPNAVVGANDHSVFGYFLRLYLQHAMPPMAWGDDAVFSMVDVDALAEGLCLAAEKAPIGTDYAFCGDPISIRDLFEIWGRFPGGMVPRLWLPRRLVKPFLVPVEPMLRACGLPAFLSRDSAEATRAHLNYSSARARSELGWTHPAPGPMWEHIVARERELIGARRGFFSRLRHLPVAPDHPA